MIFSGVHLLPGQRIAFILANYHYVGFKSSCFIEFSRCSLRTALVELNERETLVTSSCNGNSFAAAAAVGKGELSSALLSKLISTDHRSKNGFFGGLH